MWPFKQPALLKCYLSQVYSVTFKKSKLSLSVFKRRSFCSENFKKDVTKRAVFNMNFFFLSFPLLELANRRENNHPSLKLFVPKYT